MQIHPIVKRIRPLIEKRATSLYLCPLQDDWKRGLTQVQRDWLSYMTVSEAVSLSQLDDRRLRNAALGIGAGSGEWVADYDVVDERRRELARQLNTEALMRHTMQPKRPI